MNARILGALGLLGLSLGCSEQSVTVELRSLQASGDVAYVCRTPDGQGLPESECSAGALYSGERDLFALVTQTSTGEVAVVNVPWDLDNRDSDEGVVDVDPSSPGFGFLRIGARPVDIVSTPGGRATFVGVAEVGRPGIFALPTPCVGAPRPEGPNGEPAQAMRDLTTWPACSLTSAPSGLAIAFDPSERRCDGSEDQSAGLDECHVSLLGEAGPAGRRKLVATLPDEGKLVVIDAQELLDRAPGSFAPCAIEAELSLSAELPATAPEPELPEDLEGCPPAPSPLPASGPVIVARPTRIASAGSTLYVADEGAPVIHVVDVTAACTPHETPPLLPSSYWAPQRKVTASRLAVSPVTPKGRRYVYAIDEFDSPTASVMSFDVSRGSTQRTPILRERSTLIPGEQPDRVSFPSSVRDITFVLRDRPEFGEDGLSLLGEACEPDPRLSSEPGARYRPNVDRSTGARPFKLRGLFGMALLTTGEVSVIDVEDFDAPCRRPVSTNPGDVEDFRGCAGDPADLASYTLNGSATVSDEVSCRVVDPHRLRAQRLAITRSDIGTQAPSLRTLPTLGIPASARLRDFAQRPKLLAIEDLPRVFVGTTEYDPRTGPSDRSPELVLDPSLATEHSLGLPFNELRAYRNNEELRLEFEGAVSAEFRSGFFTKAGGESLGEEVTFWLSDPSALYCDAGVSDRELMAELAERRFGFEPEGTPGRDESRPSVEAFAQAFSDHVVITADFPEEDDVYWTNPLCSRDSCEQYFGEIPERLDVAELSEARQFSIVDAEQQRMQLEPRFYTDEADRLQRMDMAQCCFPIGASYQVRASRQWTLWSSVHGFRHDVIGVAERDAAGNITSVECKRDCDPRKREAVARVFEVATEACTARDDSPCQLNACVTDGRRAIRSDEPAWACAHRTSTAHFALYQGLAPSERGMAFSWQVVGGFTPLTLNLAFISSQVSPQTIVGIPDLDRLSVVDAASLGLTFVTLDGLRPLIPTVN